MFWFMDLASRTQCTQQTWERPGFKSQLCHFLDVWPWAGYLTSTFSSSAKMRIMILTLKNCEDWVRNYIKKCQAHSRRSGRKTLVTLSCLCSGRFLIVAFMLSLACLVIAGASKGKDCVPLIRWADLSLGGTLLLCVLLLHTWNCKAHINGLKEPFSTSNFKLEPRLEIFLHQNGKLRYRIVQMLNRADRHHELWFQCSSFSKLIFVTFLVFSCFLLYFWLLAVCVCCSYWPQGSSSGIRWGGKEWLAKHLGEEQRGFGAVQREALLCPLLSDRLKSPLPEHYPKGKKPASARKSHSLCFSSFHFPFCFWRELWD